MYTGQSTPLYCINTHTLITVFTVYFIFLTIEWILHHIWWRINPQYCKTKTNDGPFTLLQLTIYFLDTRYWDSCMYCMTSDGYSTSIDTIAHSRGERGRREDFRKDNVLIKIQKQIDKSTVQTPVHLGVFTHDYSVLLTVPPPYIHERRPRGKKERRREGLRNTSL